MFQNFYLKVFQKNCMVLTEKVCFKFIVLKFLAKIHFTNNGFGINKFGNVQSQRKLTVKICLETLYKIAKHSHIMIGLENQVFCPNCNKQYKDNNLPRILTMCGHTFCELCISNLISKNITEGRTDNGHPFSVQCPEDGAKRFLFNNELKVFPKNLTLIKIIQAKKVNSSFKDESFNLSKIVQKQQVQQDDEATDLISAINECKDLQNSIELHVQIEKSNKNAERIIQPQQKSTKSRQKQAEEQKQDNELCLLHQKPLEIVCIRDNKKICSKCAIFGEHRGHQFKSIQQVQKQKNQCYLSILQIFKQKQQTEQRMCNEETQSALIQILDKKKNFIENELKTEFRKLREQITKQEKTVLKKLHQTYKTTENKIKSLLQVQESSLQDFFKWEVESYKLIKILEEPDLQPKIEALYSKQRKNYKILQKGNEILTRIQQQQKSLVNKVQEILTHLSCKKSTKIYESLPDFVQILDKLPQNQIKNQNIKQKQSKMTVSTILVDQFSKQRIQSSNCTIFDAFNQKMNLLDGSPLLEQSLLEEDKDETVGSDESKSTIHNFVPEIQGRIPLKPNSKLINKNIQEDSISCSFIHLELQSAKKIPLKTASKIYKDEDQDFLQSSRISSLTSRPSLILKRQNGQRPNKKKLKSIKISEKYEKMLEGIYNNTVETIDLTNAEAGDQTMMQICEFVKFSKARTIKLIRNKLTDTGIEKLLPALSNAQILNLSQNNLTEAVIDIFIKHRYGYLSGLKNVILSQNKIIQRKHKAKIDQLRAMNIVVSV